MNDSMNDEDRHNAANALISWFQSQNIKPADGAIVMSSVIAVQLVNKSQNFNDLEEAVEAMRTLLEIDISEELKKREVD